MVLEKTRSCLLLSTVLTCFSIMIFNFFSSDISYNVYGTSMTKNRNEKTPRFGETVILPHVLTSNDTGVQNTTTAMEIAPNFNNSKPETAGITSAKKTTFHIVDAQRNYQTCDRLDIIIKARDSKNKSKVNGGDYIRVRIYNDELKAGASADGEVVYLGEGKYKASFTLRWVGKTFVRAILVHPAEAVNVLRRALDTCPARYGYYGRFTRTIGNESVAETTLCNVIPPVPNATTCDFTRHAIEEPWFCTAPTNLTCSDFAWTCANKQYSSILNRPAMTTHEQTLFKGQKQPIPVRGVNFVTVTQRDKDIPSPDHCYNERLPPCTVGSHSLSNPMAAGYFFKGNWYSNYCRRRSFVIPSSLKCLTNKTLYFHGDSTSRQYYEYLVKTLKSTLKPNPPTLQSNWKVGPSLAEDKVNNFTVHYRHHGYPIRNNWTDASEVQYIEEALDELEATPNTVYMFTIWAHLTTLNISFYEHRVRRIKAAVERLHRRSPETVVVIKSANTRGHGGAGSALTMSDWYARELDKKLREIFKSYDKKIGFIDQWSMVVGFSNVDAVHPGQVIISSGIGTLLSYICPEA